MAITFRGEVGYAEYFDASPDSELVLGAVPDGSTVIIFAATGRPDEIVSTFSLTDSSGNAWEMPFDSNFSGVDYVLAPESQGTGHAANLSCFVCYSANGLAGATLTFHRGTAPRSGPITADEHVRVFRALAFSPLTPPGFEVDSTAGQATTSSFSFASGGGAFTPFAHQVAVGAVSWSGRSGADSITPPATWTDLGFDGTDTGRTLAGDGYNLGVFGLSHRLRDRCLNIGYRIHAASGVGPGFNYAGSITHGSSPVQVAWQAKCLRFGDGDPGGGEDPDAETGSSWCLHDRWGRYHVADSHPGIRYRRSHYGTPPFTLIKQISTDTAEKNPCMIQDLRGRIILLNDTATDVVERQSADGGSTWEGAVTVFTGGKHGHIAIDPTGGGIIRSAYVDGVIKGTYQDPGDATPSAEFTFKRHDGAALVDLTVDNARHCLSKSRTSPRRWLLEVRRSGAQETWESGDDCRTWTKIA